MRDQFVFVAQNLGNLLFGFPRHRPGGLVLSLVLAVVGIAGGFVVGVVVGTAQSSKAAWLARPARLIVTIVRGVPLPLLLLIVHQFLGGGRLGGVTTSPFLSALITLALYSGAYQADIVDAGLRAVPHQLIEDARLLGCSALHLQRRVRLPYALRVMVPALTSQAISLFKDTSVVVVLGVVDLTTTARLVLGTDVGNAPYWVGTYLAAGALYALTALAFSRLARRYERRSAASGLGGRLSPLC